MKERTLRTEMRLDLPRPEIFAFFADAANLGRITPPELAFKILTPMPFELGQDSLVDYRIRLYGAPITWRTIISTWDPPNEFVDEQLRGPYSQWIHRHTFVEESPDRTLILDEVRYALPFGALGRLVHPVIRRQLKRIFSFRQREVRRILQPSSQSDEAAESVVFS
jgi:ligand-binding SRPBCC domain-containing protein